MLRFLSLLAVCLFATANLYAQSGCTIESACNFDPAAIENDGSCLWTIDCNGTCGGTFVTDDCENCFDPNGAAPDCFPGCNDPEADNYDETANYNDGSCTFDLGCIDDTACNYDPVATIDDGTCEYVIDCNGTCGGTFIEDACGNCYEGGGLQGELEFNYTGSLQTWTVPDGVTEIDIEAFGAQGGNSPGNLAIGGFGAQIRATVSVTPGDLISILVGGEGDTKINDAGTNYGGGGGGGSFIWTGNTPLVIAGGGGGAYNSTPGGEGRTQESGGNSSNGYTGGTNGNGGNAGDWCGSGGGGGWNSAGSSANCVNGPLVGGGTFDTFTGGVCTGCSGTGNSGVDGGYGGGGACWHGGGGGGGYSGGGGANNSSGNGGGGGSYYDGALVTANAGVNQGNGSVTFYFNSIPECNSGCTDPLACNYDDAADVDDGSCVLPDGCTDETACNYDPAATCNDGTCILPDGCTDDTACNYDPNAQCDNGSCAFVIDCAGVCGGNFIEDACGNCYEGGGLQGELEFNYTGSLQTWTVPDGVTEIDIEAFGAQGGNSPGNLAIGGFGAQIRATVSVTPGDLISILVGGEGDTKINDAGTNYGGGGGGGSFIWTGNTPLVIAGGGGGAYNSTPGGEGRTQESGGNSSNGYTGGTNGNGGNAGDWCGSGGGGGWNSAGSKR